jgi:hypothetical protein
MPFRIIAILYLMQEIGNISCIQCSPAELATLYNVHEQKGLSTSQAAGLKSVQGTLSSNNGGTSSATPLVLTEAVKPLSAKGNGSLLGPPTTNEVRAQFC